MRPEVSVCITAYEHARYIEQCLRSVLVQDFDGVFEVLVGDDGSCDGTRDIIDAIAMEFPQIVRVTHNAVRLGPNGNIQNLVAQAKGRFIAHLDGDDYWLPGKLRRQIPIISGGDGAIAVYSNAEVVNDLGARLGVFSSYEAPEVSDDALLEYGNFLNYSSMVYREELRHVVLSATPPFVDYLLNLRLSRLGKIAYVGEILVGYRWRSGGSMIRTMPEAVLEGQVTAICEAVASGARRSQAWGALGRLWGKFFVASILAGRFTALVRGGRRILGDEVLAYPPLMMARDSLLSLPRAIHSLYRRKFGRRVFFL